MYLGIEIGGTKLQLGVGGGESAELAAVRRAEVRPELGAEGIRRQIARLARLLMDDYPVQRIGIGFGGPVRSAQGRVITSHQIGGWDDFPLADWCAGELGRPATLENDCNAAAVAEATWGAGRGARTVFYVTVGTGVGGGLVVDGHLYGSGRPAVAEIGHLRPGLDAREPEATVESRASGRGIAAAARRRIEAAGAADDDRAELALRCGGQLERLSALDVAESAAAGNRLAAEVLEEALATLGWAIAQAVTLLAPDTVVVGGGVSLIGEPFFAGLRRWAAVYDFPPLAGAYTILPAALGETVVVHGAIALARR